MLGLRKVSVSVIPLSSTNGVQLRRGGAMSRSKSAECSLDAGDHVTRRPTTPITYTNLLNWRRGKPEVYVINDDAGHSPLGHVTLDDKRSSTGSKGHRSSVRHEGGKMATTSDETVTSFEQSSAAAAAGENSEIEMYWLLITSPPLSVGL